MKLIVNADDLGYSKGVNEGIALAFKEGLVTSTTLLVNSRATSEAIELALAGRIPQLGIHLCLTSEKPVTEPGQLSSLVDGQGRFLGQEILLERAVELNEVELELRGQIEWALSRGVNITHLDSHHHVHLNPSILAVVVKLAKAYQLPVRAASGEMGIYLRQQGVLTPDYFIGTFYGEQATGEHLLKELAQAKKVLGGQGWVELMVHPAVLDEELLVNSSYTSGRQIELELLLNPDLAQSIRDMGYQLSSYKDYGREI